MMENNFKDFYEIIGEDAENKTASKPKKTTKTNPWLKTRIGFLVVIIFPDDYDGIVTIKKSKFAL